MKRLVLLSCVLALATIGACSSFGGSDAPGGGGSTNDGGPGGDDGGSNTLDGSHGTNDDAGNVATDGGAQDGGGGDSDAAPTTFCHSTDVLCQDFTTLTDDSAGWFRGTFYPSNEFTFPLATGAESHSINSIMQAWVVTIGPGNGSVYATSPAFSAVTNFTFTLRFTMDLGGGTLHFLKLLASNNSAVLDFTADATSITATPSYSGTVSVVDINTLKSVTTSGQRTLTVSYSSADNKISMKTDDNLVGVSVTFNNAQLSQTQVGAQSTGGVTHYVRGYRLTAP